MTSQVRPSSPTKKLVTSLFFGSFIVLVYKTMKTKTKTKTKKKKKNLNENLEKKKIYNKTTYKAQTKCQ